MIALDLVLVIPASLLLLLALYILVQAFSRMKASPRAWVRWPGQVLFALAVLPGLLLDVLLQYTVVALLFWDPAARCEHTVTQRLERYLASGAGRRAAVARFVCRRLLDPLDPSGCHCRT
ncbi:MAG: hypothetical protein JWQ72_3202 [Polaromonas sp.]|nr:hypothetical protein [Polaromonas sp.]